MAERIDPGNPTTRPTYWQHYVVYEYALPYVMDKVVLDAGCGEGYGTHLLTPSAKKIVGVDYAKKVIKRAASKYQKPNLTYQVMDLTNLECEDSSFDIICCFQVIEHLKHPERFLLAARKILKSSGMLLLSTPNRRTSAFDWPYHFREYTAEELTKLLEQFFPSVKLNALHASEKMKTFRALQAQSSEGALRFDPFSIRKLLPRRLLQLVFSIGAFFLRTHISKTHDELAKNITVKDFHISDCNFNEAFDLIALCQKSRKWPKDCPQFTEQTT